MGEKNYAQQVLAQQDSRRKEAAVVLQDLGRMIEDMFEWGCHAKDPLGNFMPKVFGDEVTIAYNKLKRLIEGGFSDMPYQSKGYPGLMWRSNKEKGE